MQSHCFNKLPTYKEGKQYIKLIHLLMYMLDVRVCLENQRMRGGNGMKWNETENSDNIDPRNFQVFIFLPNSNLPSLRKLEIFTMI